MLMIATQHSTRRYLLIAAITIPLMVIVYFTSRSSPPAPPALDHIVLHGETMGTTYNIRYRPAAGIPTASEVQRLIDDELESVNRQMSTYRKDSELSQFNDSRSTEWFPVSEETAFVVELAQQIAVATQGAFDVTVGPLVDLWGFGPGGRRDSLPTSSEVEAAKAMTGYEHLSVRLDPPALRKRMPELQVDLSAIAKGHGSDRVAALLKSKGVQHLFVEIGGEIVTEGYRLGTQPWQIGIEAPRSLERSVQVTIGLSGAALATSGNYRNFFQVSDSRFSHTIDPKTGRPVTHQLASATVVANNSAMADAIATSMMVLGPMAGLQLAETNHWSVLLIHVQDDRMELTSSTHFQQHFPEVWERLNSEQAEQP